MLRHLHIQNYALISHLDIDFGEGFSVLTGETGSGKSIILGALSLVLGARADSKAITDGEEKCIIEAEFDEGIIRRELYSNGKSRSFVDDSVVTLQELKVLANKLIDIHSQHANLLIENEDFQLGIVDAVADNSSLMEQYSADYTQYLEAVQTLNELQALAKNSQQDADYIQYRFKLLDEAELEEGELEELETEQYRLSHAEEIRESLSKAVQILNGDEGSAIDMLRACHLDSAEPELQARIDSARIELQDIAEEAERSLNNIDIDPRRLEWVEERLDTINGLLHKFSAESVAELIRERDELAAQVERMDSFDFDIAQAKKEVDAKQKALTQTASALTKSRKEAIPSICKQLIDGMKRLGVPHAKIEFSIHPTPDFLAPARHDNFTPTGCDDVQILFAANLNQNLRAVNEVASGGEISRLMLCVKSLIASTKGLPTIIFDEIDTGVSGDIATQMASIMREMALSRQIIAITHLPQIAALGQTHYRVYKADTDTRTETHINRLTNEQRITEIATMLSGNIPSPEAIANAKQLLCCH